MMCLPEANTLVFSVSPSRRHYSVAVISKKLCCTLPFERGLYYLERRFPCARNSKMELRLVCSLQRVPARNDLSYLIASPPCHAFQLLSSPRPPTLPRVLSWFSCWKTPDAIRETARILFFSSLSGYVLCTRATLQGFIQP